MKYFIMFMLLFINFAQARFFEVSDVTTNTCGYLTGVPYRNKVTLNTKYIKHISHINGRAQIETLERNYFCSKDSYEVFMEKYGKYLKEE